MWQVHTVLYIVLYHEQVRRGAWFLHDLSGNASQLSLPCMIRLECRHDVFHALGNARDGERVSFLTNSPHIARKVEGSKRREDLDFEICEGLRQQVGDAEMQYVKKHAVYEKVSMSQCWKETGKNLLKTGWADTNNGKSERPNIGSRWAAKEYNTGPRPDLSSAASPLERGKLVISEAASSNQKGTVLLVIDVRRAYCNARARRRVYIELPEGDSGGPGSRQCGLLRKSLNGHQ